MKLTINTYKYIKQEDVKKEITLPDTKTFYFEKGIRRSIAVIPRWTTTKIERGGEKEEIYCYKILCLYQFFKARIETLNIDISDIEKILNTESSDTKNLLDFLIEADNSSLRTEEQFMNHYNDMLEEHKELLEI